MRKNWGLPYMGSKNKIASEIIEILPKGERLIDLFGGGGAISHCAYESGKWGKVVYNDYNKMISDTVKKAFNGGFKDENRWISREEFKRLKGIDGYATICFSYGNRCNTYLYGRDIEPYKKAIHYAIVFDDFSYMDELLPEIVKDISDALEGITDRRERRLAYQRCISRRVKRILKQLQNLEVLERIQVLERLERIENLERLERIENLERLEDARCDMDFLNLSYDEVELRKDDIIYCDIPYNCNGRQDYIGSFDWVKFYNWCREMRDLGYRNIYLSEYNAPEDIFEEIWHKDIKSPFAQRKTVTRTERLFRIRE